MAARVELQHLSKSFGHLRAVDDVSFSVEQGEVLGFLGPNGAGKSTTMKMVTGFLAPTSGRALVCGHDVQEEPIAVKRRVGYLPEGAPSYGEMTPEGFLRFVGEVRGLRGSALRAAVGRAADQAQLGGVMAQRIETLSKGYRRRVGIAQAILHDPEVLILDEPTDGLDPNQKHEMRHLIREMGRGKVIVLSTHILEEVDAVCTRAIIIAGGRLLADGAPEAFLEHGRTESCWLVTLRADDPTAAQELLGQAPGATSVDLLSAEGGRCRLRVHGRKGVDLAPALARRAVEAGLEVEALAPEQRSLDEVFRQITQKGEVRGTLAADGKARAARPSLEEVKS